MCDDARNNADSGAYCIEEEKMLENKAKMIVDCFIDSDIPPRVQVIYIFNVTGNLYSVMYPILTHDSLSFYFDNPLRI